MSSLEVKEGTGYDPLSAPLRPISLALVLSLFLASIEAAHSGSGYFYPVYSVEDENGSKRSAHN
jgi:hypothetical protein